MMKFFTNSQAHTKFELSSIIFKSFRSHGLGVGFILFSLFSSANSAFSQVTISGGSSVNGAYTTIAAAVTALNGATISGPVTVDVVGGHSETAPVGGIVLTATGTAANTITFQKSGGANPVINAYVGTQTPISTTRDGMFILSGSDYVTINGINLTDSNVGTETEYMECGYGLFKATADNGCQFNTIKNCVITLNRNSSRAWTVGHNGSIGISVNNVTYAAPATALTPTMAGGSNSSNQFYSNTIQQCNSAIAILGFVATVGVGPNPDPATFLGDLNNDIGGAGASTGNTILNFGGDPAAISPSNGIFANNQWSMNCSYNTINNNNGSGANHTNTLRGIFFGLATSTSANLNCNFNNVTIQGGGTTTQVSGIEGGFGSTPAANTVNFNNNTIAVSYLTATTGIMQGILTSSAPATLNINNNTISNFVYSAVALTGTGSVHGISSTGAATTVNANNNIISNFSRTGTTGGSTWGIQISSGTNQNAKSNSISNIMIDGTGTSSQIIGIQVATGTIVVDNNTVDNLKCLKTTGSSLMYGIYDVSSPTNENYNFNTVSNLMHNGTGTVYGLFMNTVSGVRTVSNNTVFNLSTGGTTIGGINQTTSSPTIFKNKIYNITSTSTGAPLVFGLQITTLGTSGMANVYNNLIGNLFAPNASSSAATSPTLRGINITSTTTTSNFNISYNTVYVNGSTTGANFATAALFVTTSTTATSSNLTLKNNILVNLSQPKGVGFTVAYQRSSTTLTNYNSASDRNLFFAGGPCASRLIFYDGTNQDQTLAAFKARVAPADANSVTEEPSFLSTTGSSNNFLHINPAIPTVLESNATPIATITDDYDGNTRNATTPDIGADEFAGSTTACTGTPIGGTVSGTTPICSGMATTLCLSGHTAGLGITVQWQSSPTAGGPFTDVTCAGASCLNTGNLAAGTYFYRAVVSCSGGSTATSNEFTVVVNPSPAPTITPSAPTICNGKSVGLTATGGVTYTWSPATGLNMTTGATVTASPTVTTTYRVTASDAIGCTGTATVVVSVIPSPTVTATATPTTVCLGGNSQLNATANLGFPAYNRTVLTGQTYAQLTGSGITVINTTAQLLAGFGSQSQDDGGVVITIPFTFSYMGQTYTQMSFCTNGWVGAGNWGTIDAVNSRAPANLFTTTIPNSTLAAWFRDMGANFGTIGVGSMRHGLIGTDVYAFQWDQAVGSSFSETTTNLISFQVNIYGPASATPGRIEYIYGPQAGTLSTGASLGIEDAVGGPTHYINALDGSGTSTTTATVWPGNGSGYRFDPVAPAFAWSPTTFLNNATIANPLASGINQTTTYIVTVTSSNGCTGTASVTVTADPIINIGVAETSGIANGDGIICAGASATLTASGGTSYSWSTTETTAAITVTPSGTTTYTVTVTNSATGCTGTKTVTITVNSLPTVSISSSNAPMCLNGTRTLTGTPSGGTFTILGSSTGTGTIGAGNLLTATGVGVLNIEYSYTDPATGCSNKANQSITINPLPTITIAPPASTICNGQSVTLTASGGVSYLWNTTATTAAITVNPSATTTYTVTGTDANGCQSTATATVTVNPTPNVTETHVEPSSCVAPDGSINLTVTGTGPFTYNWVGPTGALNLVQGQEDQSGLIVGSYFVTVTGGNGCTKTLTIPLAGPGGCSVCPTMGALNVSASTVCAGANFTLSATGLTGMGTTYGVQFKQSTAAVDPYTGGTVIATVPNGSLTGGGSTATASVNLPAGNYFLYAIVTPNPLDPGCRPSVSGSIVVNPVPSVNTVSNQTYCAGASVPSVVFTSPVSGAVFNWSRTVPTPDIGLSVNSGTGDVPAFTATNTGNAPTTATFSVVATFTNNGVTCTGTPIQFTITVNPNPSVTTVTNKTFCAGSTSPAITFASNVANVVFSWSRTVPTPDIGTVATSGTGPVPAFTTTNTGNAPITSTFSVVASFTNNGVTCTGAPIQFTITVNPIPTVNAVANQVHCAGATVPETVFGSPVSGTTYSWTRTAGAIGLAATSGTGNVPTFTAANTTTAPITSTFTVTPSFTDNGVTCTGTAIQYTVTVNPSPTVNAVANQSYCAGAVAPLTPLTTSQPGATISWTRTAGAIGLAATSGTGDIPSYTTTNPGTTPIVVTFTVTASFTANGVTCTGTATTFTVSVNPVPTQFLVTGNAQYCTTDQGAPVGLINSQTGVNYQLILNGTTNVGAPVPGTGSAISFGLRPSGTYTVVGTFAAGGCSSTMLGSLVVTTTVCNVSITDPCVCKNNATTLFDGQFSETVTVNAPAGQTWTVTAINGLYSASSGNPPAAPSPIPTGTTLANLGGTYQLTGVHVDALGYSVSVSNGAGTTLSIPLTRCYYPNPEIVEVGGPYCLNSPDVVLQASVENNPTAVSAKFVVNGVDYPATFNATNNLWEAAFNVTALGNYTVEFVFDAGTATANNPSDPGCIQKVGPKFFQVVETPETVICNELVHVSLDETCTATILPDMILEGTYGCYDDYTVTVTPLPFGAPLGNTVNADHIGKKFKVTITHINSNNTCWGEILVEDKLAPMLTCADISVSCAVQNYQPNDLSALGFTTAFPTIEECDDYTRTYDDTWTDAPCGLTGGRDISGFIRRVWTAVDNTGNVGTCQQTIYFMRAHVDQVVFPADISVSCTSGATDPSVTGVPRVTLAGRNYNLYPSVSLCEMNIAYTDQNLPVCDGTYKILRTWVGLDWCLPTNPGPTNPNPRYFIQVIQVKDDQGPTVVNTPFCGTTIPVDINPLDCQSDYDLPDITVTDNCSRPKSIRAEWKLDGVTYGTNGYFADFPGNNHWDPDTLAVVGTAANLPLGTTTITYIITDDCDNSRTCTFTANVVDNVQPIAVCDEFTQVSLNVDGKIFVDAEVFDDGSFDNCGPIYFKARRMLPNDCLNDNNLFHDQILFCCADVGDTVMVVVRVYDAEPDPDSVAINHLENRAADCMVSVYIDDKIRPTCIPPAHVTVSCEAFDPSLWAYGAAVSTDNCCLDSLTEIRNLANFDTLCNRGTIVRRWTAKDCYGNTNACTQRIVINYNQDYHIRFPNDRVLFECDGTTAFGEPVINKKDCELMAISYEDQVFTVVPDACYKIERLWTIINWCTYDPNTDCIYVPNPSPNPLPNASANLQGPTVSPLGTPNPWAPTQTALEPGGPQVNFSQYWQKEANCYQYRQIIKIIDNEDPIITAHELDECDLTANDPLFWNNMDFWDPIHGSHDLCEAPVKLSITAIDSCSQANLDIRALVFLDLNGDGVMETVLNTNTFPTLPPGFMNINNAANPNYAGGQSIQFDYRPVPPNLRYRWALREQVINGQRKVTIAWTDQANPNNANNAHWVTPQVPLGKHKIKWFVEDNCGNETIWESPWNVRDCKAPTVVCLNGLSVNIMPTKMIVLWTSDFLHYGEDNCTPANQLVYSIRKSGTGSGFPVDQNGNPIPGLTWTCNELGTQYVELWAKDAAGNAAFCETYVIIQDPNGLNCTNIAKATVAGDLKTEKTDGLEDASVELSGTHPALPQSLNDLDLTDEQGHYEFTDAVPIAGNYTVTPVKDDNPLNGVTTFDLLLISKHILGVEPLTSPYKMIAADANRSGSITTFDIVEIRKLILGIYNELPSNTSWRFVDKYHNFADPNNPFTAPIPETISIADLQSNTVDEHFVAVKIGDVNQNAVANNLQSADDRTAGTLLFDVDDREVKSGETVEVKFTAAEKSLGYQFTLTFNNLELLDILPASGTSAENFAVFAKEKALTTSVFSDEKAEFSIKFRATAAGKLSKMLGVSSRITKAEAYNLAAERQEVALRFNQNGTATVAGVGFELYQNQPNPFVNSTSIGFHLPEATEATLTVYDETGRALLTKTGSFAKGLNAITLERKALNYSGLLFYKLETATDAATRTMIQSK